ncbi:MAG: rhodanese-like domain-containing protein [Chloroflexi bacterium]|uniref:Rhodanese-like domain-containing protein n=1 Tax=Candidatus Chlorohelix allophototropha TaxID=3003348 RepID=A0A8T7MAA7_9CHLR|nr:rhodanese-like domain-containing protein [Chloroflexota bacterium]WJW68923.1 rhodanese-like domain-containing protein [Chloroflexota bacterium L227-S17]
MSNLRGAFQKGYSDITPIQAEQRIKETNPLVVDVREPNEYAAGHIKDSVLIPLGQVGMRIDELGPKEGEIILVCHSGGRSSYAANMLAAQGFTNLSNIIGGTMAWAREGLPLYK